MTSLLLGSGMLHEPDAPGRTSDGASPALRCWEFHDLLFHARSRLGPSDSRIGGIYPVAGRLDPGPALKPVEPTETLDLYGPDLDTIQRDDPPFGWVQEARRSVREYANEPMTARQLGEFLYRVARARDCLEKSVETPRGPVRLGVASRPYPSGGALYELELYVAINACEGLAKGLHYYDPLGHRLCRLPSHTADVQQLLREAAIAAQIPDDSLQVLLIVTARFGRIAWKYSGIAYSLILKNVGVLLQTMYLAATAMGLAPCAVGAGDASLFARAAGADRHAEASVGEFLLGSNRRGVGVPRSSAGRCGLDLQEGLSDELVDRVPDEQRRP
jgi:SagB-type dehydrogenase family enzyme